MATFNFQPLTADGKPIKQEKVNNGSSVKSKTNSPSVPTSRFIALRADGKPADSKEPIKVPEPKQPTFGGRVVRGIVRPFATLGARPVQLVKALGGATPEQQTIHSNYLGDIPTVQTGKDVLKDVGRAAEVVSYGVGVGALRDTAGNIIKQSFKQAAPRLALQGAGAGALGSGGNAISEGKPIGEVLKDTAKGAAFGGILNVGLGGLGSVLSKEGRALNKGSTWIEKSKTPEEIRLAAQARAGEINIPEAGVKPLQLPRPKTPSETAIELPASGILSSAERLRNPIKQTVESVDTPVVSMAKSINSKNDFISRYNSQRNKIVSEVESNQRFNNVASRWGDKSILKPISEIPEKLNDKQLSKVWEDAHSNLLPTKKVEPLIPNTVKEKPIFKSINPDGSINDVPQVPSQTELGTTNNIFDSEGFRPVGKDEILPNGAKTKVNIQTGEMMTDAPIKEGYVPPTKEVPPVQNTERDNIIKSAIEDSPEAQVFERGTWDAWRQKVSTLSDEDIKQIAKGNKKNPFPEVPVWAYKDAASKLFKDDYATLAEIGNATQVDRVVSRSGQELGAVNMIGRDEPLRVIARVKSELEEKLTPAMKAKVEKENIDIAESIIKQSKSGKLEPEILDDIVNRLFKC